MRRLNSSIKAGFISEKGADNIERTYFSYVPLENMACYAVAESYDRDVDINSAKLAVEAVLTAFEREPSFRSLKRYIQYAHEQIVSNSVKNKLEAAITVVVSDYTRIRYASCGNIKLYLLSGNSFYLKSETQTYYQFAANEYGIDKALLPENKNLLQYLGQSGRSKPYISKKIDLPEESTLLFATSNIWERVDDVEILDAYEESEQDNFLSSVQELYLLTQFKNPAIGSYTIASLFVERTFKEDAGKKKKRRRIILIAAVILIIAVIIAMIIISVIRAGDRREMSEIIRLDGEGIRYSSYGNYSTAYEQYDKASEYIGKLKNNLHYKKEKTALADMISLKRNFFNSILEGDKAFENGDYLNARKSYKNAQNAYHGVFSAEDADSGLLIAEILAEKLALAEKYIEAEELINSGEMYEAIGMYQEALAKYREAEGIVKTIGDLELRKELMTRILEANEKMSGIDGTKPVLQLKMLMEGAEGDLDFETALQYCELIKSIYSDSGIADNSTQEDINRIERKIELNKDAGNYIEKAKEAEGELRYDDAIRNYNMVLKIYGDMEVNTGHRQYRFIEDEIFRLEGIKAIEDAKGKEADEASRQLRALMESAENDLDFAAALQYCESIAGLYKDSEAADAQIQDDISRIERKIELNTAAGNYIEKAKEAESVLRYGDAVRNYEMALKIYGDIGLGAGHKTVRYIEDEIFRLEGIIIIDEIENREAQEAAEAKETEEPQAALDAAG